MRELLRHASAKIAMDVYAQAGVIVRFRQFAKAQILGHAGGDPVFQVSSKGYAIAKFSVATNEQKKNTQTGEYTAIS